MSPDIYERQNPQRTRVLRLFSPADIDFLGRTDVIFDAIQIGSDIPSLEPLAPYADRITWIDSCAAESAAGLERLVQLERLEVDGSCGYRFDYRLLPKLRHFECDGADLIPAKFLNHPAIEHLSIASAKIDSFALLNAMRRLQRARLSNCKLKSLAEIDKLHALRELRLHLSRSLADVSALSRCLDLQLLEIAGASKLRDVSAICGLRKLRVLAIDAPKAELADIDWIEGMAELRCAGLYVPVRRIDWQVLARHRWLYDLVIHSVAGGLQETDDEIISSLQSAGRRVKALTRFKVPAVRIEFEPDAELVDPRPLPYYENNLGQLPEN